MPHIVIEYSANLDVQTDIPALVRVTHEAVFATGEFALEAIRTRTARREVYRIADGDPRNAFVAVVGRIAPGRTGELRHSIGKAVFEAVQTQLATLSASIPLSLTVELHEIEQTAAFRHNTILPRPA
jgi:5-carboxymethyl-2-hydroxymuconate isomerase